ncbi:MAG: rod shape-determining protein RodA [Treponema sp.]|nr:rod shape-determining protein RodA [Treponema sp.]
MRLRDNLEIDFLILIPVLFLIAIGVFFIYSSGMTSPQKPPGLQEYERQIIFASVGIIAVFILAMFNYRRFYDFSLYMYLLALIPLIYTIVFGKTVYGTRRIGLGDLGIQVQFSEFVKITTIIYLARYLSDTKRTGKSLVRFIVSCIIVFIPMCLVLLQPDLGTAIVFISILLLMAFISGISMRYIIFSVLCIFLTGLFIILPLWQMYILKSSQPFIVMLTAMLTSPFFVGIIIIILSVISIIALIGFLMYRKQYFFWMLYSFAIVIISFGTSYIVHKFLANYQIMRLIVFLDPSIDPLEHGWNIIQSVTAVGSGGIIGKGFLQGTHSHYRYLPVQSTDFIFSIFSEETGFIGGIIVFALFLVILLRLIRIIKKTTDPFAEYICAGFTGVFSFHFLINVGMAMGIMPITGIPLSFISYGGSSLVSSLIGIGLIQSIYVRRKTHQPI